MTFIVGEIGEIIDDKAHFLLIHNKYIIYYYVHYVYTLLKRVIAKEKS